MSLTLNVPVFAANGDLIGTVGDVRGELFKVDVPPKLGANVPGYWLSGRCVATVSVAGVYLAVREDHLGPYKLEPVGVSHNQGGLR